jgi:hypothetical protein
MQLDIVPQPGMSVYHTGIGLQATFRDVNLLSSRLQLSLFDEQAPTVFPQLSPSPTRCVSTDLPMRT